MTTNIQIMSIINRFGCVFEHANILYLWSVLWNHQGLPAVVRSHHKFMFMRIECYAQEITWFLLLVGWFSFCDQMTVTRVKSTWRSTVFPINTTLMSIGWGNMLASLGIFLKNERKQWETHENEGIMYKQFHITNTSQISQCGASQ